MPPKFGTSGLRGLVTELTDDLVAEYTRAFLTACPHGGAVHVGQDLRGSSPRIAEAVIGAVRGMGLRAVDHGVLPTPALALASMGAGQAAIMVTGSHIPADRNGLKFYLPGGEIAKSDEAAIGAALGSGSVSAELGEFVREAGAVPAYVARYVDAFGSGALKGLRIGVYEHSSVARDALADALGQMGAEVVRLARADHFIPVDTEAVDAETREMLKRWCADHALDALVSTDGDADRPMVVDASGTLVPGDVLGPLVARMLGADVICTPVSSNTLVDQLGFGSVIRTRIGSPFVIAAMEDAGGKVVGYEANGGFLLGFAADGPAGKLAPLMTRDCLLPIVSPLAMARAQGVSLAGLLSELPPRFTAADRIAGIATEASQAFITELTATAEARAAFFVRRAEEVGLDLTDGLRVSFADGSVIHLRPSGNAPEFRCYAEAESVARAESLMRETLAAVADRVG
ncbi:phosphomannomutase [Marivita geojedonensis]|uniref:Phosphomannomutase n=1 Tax=Marivita geojedonensis TaxID=1123756 RepID=A0A1X4NB92_9RHOB|nr:phosphomannomutase [Marivita geojedonensis]OSQ43868.1 phosphomannomutase [Marivita geojedonensis]PRY72501.1 phosphomannomutase [Marivita geojedonensis]